MPPAGSVLKFEIALSDVDRGNYEPIAVQVAQHPSESPEYLVTRVLAYALEFREGIAFSHGLHAADEPAVWIHDLTGRLETVIEVGTPDVARIHKFSKSCGEVVIWCHKDAPHWLASLKGQRVHASERVKVVEVPKALVAWLVARLDRRNRWELSRSDGELYVSIEGDATTATLIRHDWPA